MAGSYKHLIDKSGNFTFDLIDNMGDAHEACEECYYLIRKLNREHKILRTKLSRTHSTWGKKGNKKVKIHNLKPGEEFKVLGDDSSTFTYLGCYRHGYDHYTAEDAKYQKHYFNSSEFVIKIRRKVMDDLIEALKVFKK